MKTQGNEPDANPRSVAPWLSSLMMKRSEAILSRLAHYHEEIAHLPRPWRRRLRQKLAATALGGSMLLALIWSGAWAGQPADYDSPMPQPPGAVLSGASTQDDRPNIVVIMTDDQDADSMTTGDGNCLPAMRKLLSYPEGSWVNFTQAHVSRSLCSPSRATFLTGQYAYNHGVMENEHWDVLDQNNTLPNWLNQAGYRTGAVGKYVWWIGWDTAGGPEANVDTQTDLAVQFINNPSDEPFFLWLAYDAPHMLADPPARYEATNVCVPPNRPNFDEADVSDKPWWIKSKPLLSSDDKNFIQAERLASQRELLAVDDGVEQVIASLKANGKLDNTLVIYVGDNGYSWGSHRHIGKFCEFEECNKVPLLIRYPGLSGNAVYNTHVSNVDITATILDYADVAPGLPADGTSLLPVLQNPSTPRSDTVFLEDPVNSRYYGITNTEWKYVERNQGELELYDLKKDPFELVNVANQPAYQAVQSQLAQVLSTLKPGAPTPTPTATTNPMITPTPTLTPSASPTTMPTLTPSASPTTMPTPTPTATLTGTSVPGSFELMLPMIHK
jgi:arylsulfatase A-like enzyme